MVQEIHGNHVVPYHPVEGEEKVFEVDWSTPFRRVPMIPELEKQLGVTFPPATEFGKPGRHALIVSQALIVSHAFPPPCCWLLNCICCVEFVKFLEEVLLKHGVECSPPRTAPRMLDKVYNLAQGYILLNIIMRPTLGRNW